MKKDLKSALVGLFIAATPLLAAENISAPSAFERWATQDYLLGDWGGKRTELSRHGADFEFFYLGTVPNNLAGGLKTGSLYQGMVLRLAGEPDGHIKTALTELAEKSQRPRLLELTALLSALQSKLPQALDLLEHAESTTKDPAELLRLRLYRAEMLRRNEKADAARTLLREVLKDDRFKVQPSRTAAESLLKDMGG